MVEHLGSFQAIAAFNTNSPMSDVPRPDTSLPCFLVVTTHPQCQRRSAANMPSPTATSSESSSSVAPSRSSPVPPTDEVNTEWGPGIIYHSFAPATLGTEFPSIEEQPVITTHYKFSVLYEEKGGYSAIEYSPDPEYNSGRGFTDPESAKYADELRKLLHPIMDKFRQRFPEYSYRYRLGVVEYAFGVPSKQQDYDLGTALSVLVRLSNVPPETTAQSMIDLLGSSISKDGVLSSLPPKIFLCVASRKSDEKSRKVSRVPSVANGELLDGSSKFWTPPSADGRHPEYIGTQDQNRDSIRDNQGSWEPDMGASFNPTMGL